MTDTGLRERKTKKVSKKDQEPEPEKEKTKSPVPQKSRSILQRLFLAALLAVAISYVLTGTLFYGFKFPTMAKMKRILVIYAF